MSKFGLSCDDITYRLIQSIPPGLRSKTIREAILAHAPEIENLRDEFWEIELERKIAEKQRQDRFAIIELERKIEEKQRQDRFAIEAEKRRQHLGIIAQLEADEWWIRYSNADILIETSGNTCLIS